jgi:hypothetical protein
VYRVLRKDQHQRQERQACRKLLHRADHDGVRFAHLAALIDDYPATTD